MARRIEYVMPLVATMGDGSRIEGFASVARGYWQRLAGLMGQEAQPEGCGLLFPRCTSIHTFWMRFPIDVVWLAEPRKDGRTLDVKGIEPALPKAQVRIAPRGTWGAIEFPAHTFAEAPSSIEIDRLTLADIRR